MTATPRTISADQLKAALHDGHEIALLDAREEVPYHERHLLMAACVPLGRLEAIVPSSVPRKSTRVVWCDDGEGLAQRAAARMTALGYPDVAVLDGGIAAWEQAGHRIYSGVHVPSKAFAEVVEHAAHTPWITAEELKAMMDRKENFVLFDSRSFEEFHENSIPTAISVPGAELVYRFADLVSSADTTVVVNCGGRTRSIIGAQSLINAGVPNKVVSLRNGTQDWHLYGYEVLKGSTARAPAVSPTGAAMARTAANRVAERFGIPRIDGATLAGLLAEKDRTTYVFDVRTAEEYATRHVAGMKHIAGGQLIQETDRHAAVWGARVVLVDDDGVRAVMTAHWMKQMGWDACALTLDMAIEGNESGAWIAPVAGIDESTPTLDVAALKAALDAGRTSVVDVDWSKSYRNGHVPGAWFGLRTYLDAVLARLPASDTVVFTSSDGRLAMLAAAEASPRRTTPVFALAGGTQAWRDAGLPLESGETRMASPADDIRLKAREQKTDIEAAMKAYLTWEIELANQMASDDDQRFHILTP
jgi:rhodanese-related sulfurtransferase